MATRWTAVALMGLCSCEQQPVPAPSEDADPKPPLAVSAPVATASSTIASASASPASATAVAPTAEGSTPPADMVVVPEGYFLMGSPVGQGNPEEHPMHERSIARLWMDKTEVTAGAYAKCVQAGKCPPANSDDQFCTASMPNHEDHPINCIDHAAAVSYCAFVNKRLPSEAEWEYAASGGAEGRKFSWGNNDPTTQIACYSHPGGTCKVASFAPGAFGLFDMSGNVWEWTDSWFSLFPEEAREGKRKLFKGGSWSRRWPKWLRVKNRSHWEPTKSNSWLGFRCVKNPSPVICPVDSEPVGHACKRVRGAPLCEPNYGFNGTECTPIGSDGKPMAHRPKSEIKAGEMPSPDDPISVARTPGDDGDCQKNYPGKPAAYRWTGNTWEARVKLVAGKGCTRRDNAPTWVSACCPN